MFMFRPRFDSNDDLVDSLVARGIIGSDRVEEAFRSVDRADFVPGERQDEAYNDYALPLGEESTISGPHMVAINTELLDVEEGDSVLEIGSGSGYQLAILSELVGEEGEVIGVEILEELVEKSRKRLKERGNVKVMYGSGFDPVEEESGDRVFDSILYSCAVDSLEQGKKHLREGGVLVAPVNEDDHQVMKRFQGGEVSRHQRVRFVEFQEG
jgi:protein-L-isoaspartate(D-aspartate) O-methyltransferase